MHTSRGAPRSAPAVTERMAGQILVSAGALPPLYLPRQRAELGLQRGYARGAAGQAQPDPRVEELRRLLPGRVWRQDAPFRMVGLVHQCWRDLRYRRHPVGPDELPAGLPVPGANASRTLPPMPAPNSPASAGVSTMSVVDRCGGSLPARTVIRSWLEYWPSRLPLRLLVRKEPLTRPWIGGAPFRPTYSAWETTPGSDEIGLFGRVSGMPGRSPGTFTKTSLAAIEIR